MHVQQHSAGVSVSSSSFCSRCFVLAQVHVFTQDDETRLFSALHPNPKQF
jgi:hypothetical protein